MAYQGKNLILVILSLAVFHIHLSALDQKRPENWATPLSLPGLKNLFKVSDQLYRGAKPQTQGIIELQKQGVKTIVNLEMYHSDRKKIQESQTGLGYEHLFVNTLKMNDKQIIQFLKIVTDPTKTPVFLHCYHGSDRTGTFTAAYRIVVQGWTKDEAINEMVNGGFGYHKMFKNLIVYLKQMDVDKIKKEVLHNQQKGK